LVNVFPVSILGRREPMDRSGSAVGNRYNTSVKVSQKPNSLVKALKR
jgi:hypothetical protein